MHTLFVDAYNITMYIIATVFVYMCNIGNDEIIIKLIFANLLHTYSTLLGDLLRLILLKLLLHKNSLI